MIDRIRTFIGYREYPKYSIVSRFFVYKQALMKEARRLMQARVLREKEDIFYLTFQELHDIVRTNRVDDQLIRGARTSMALSADRSTLAVGAALESSAARTIGGDQADNSALHAGAAYVFTRSNATWSQQAYVKASNTDAEDRLGWSAAFVARRLGPGAPRGRRIQSAISPRPREFVC